MSPPPPTKWSWNPDFVSKCAYSASQSDKTRLRSQCRDEFARFARELGAQHMLAYVQRQDPPWFREGQQGECLREQASHVRRS